MLNRTVLIGRLTRDPEMRYTSTGVALTRFSVAVDRKFSNQQGEREADFINIVAWRGLAENCSKYLRKGSLVGLEGRIQTGKYENQEGRTVYTTEVVADDVRFLESRSSSENRAYNGGSDMNSDLVGVAAPPKDPFAGDAKTVDISEDDLPF